MHADSAEVGLPQVTIVVDDLFPHKNGKLMFSQPNGDEEWVLILEKAFAKLCGSYHAIEGGLVLWAFLFAVICTVGALS